MGFKFLHVRIPGSQKGGKTVAYFSVDDCTIRFATAVCSKRDNYCRKTGRMIATGRLYAGKGMTLQHSGKPIDVILTHIGHNGTA